MTFHFHRQIKSRIQDFFFLHQRFRLLLKPRKVRLRNPDLQNLQRPIDESGHLAVHRPGQRLLLLLGKLFQQIHNEHVVIIQRAGAFIIGQSLIARMINLRSFRTDRLFFQRFQRGCSVFFSKSCIHKCAPDENKNSKHSHHGRPIFSSTIFFHMPTPFISPA